MTARLPETMRLSLRTAAGATISPAVRGRASLTPLAAILGDDLALFPAVPIQEPAPRPQLSPAESISDRIRRLESLEVELYRLLATTAPDLWIEIRRPLTKLLRRSRRALRAIERAQLAE